MAAYKIQSVLLLAFILLQGSLSQPVPQQPPQETEAEAIAHEKFNALVNQYSAKLVDVARNILKDEDLLKNKDPEIVAFMQSLSLILIKYDAATKVETKMEVMQYLGSLPGSFENIPKDKVTPSTQLMQETLKRYGMMKIVEELDKEFSSVMGGLEELRKEKINKI